ncbi:hypothetical protein OQA88_10172 [Cercophora sp. LCS_1]
MAKERDTGDASGTSQSKRPTLNRYESSSDQTQQHPSHHPHRTKSQKHVVGGGGRLHARVPSTKALHKHHAATSSTKLNRRRSLSPDNAANGPPLASGHRRVTSDLKLSEDTPKSAHMRKNSSQTSLKRNRSHVDVGKKTKSATNLKRSQSNPAVHKLKSGGASKVHFKLGDDDPDNFEADDGGEDEWVDASTSASPLLSRRSSTAAGAQLPGATAATNDARPASAASYELDATQDAPTNGAQQQGLSQSFNRDLASHKQYITSRILQRTPSHGAPPMMSTETASARPSSSRQHSPDSTIDHETSTLAGTPRMLSQARPGSSGKQELTSRFVGHNSQEPGSEIPIDTFLNAAHHNGISRVATTDKLEANGPRRPRSMGNLAQARGQNHGLQMKTATESGRLTDEEDVETNGLGAGRRFSRRNGGYVVPTDMSRTQQKLNLQRASSSLETAHPHPAMSMGFGGVSVAAVPLSGGSSYDSRDPRLGKLLERTGMEYLVVRRYQNPIARSLARLAQLPGANQNRPIPRPGTAASRRSEARSEYGARGGLRDRDQREQSMATLIGGQSARRPVTPRSAFSARQMHSASSSLEDDDVSRLHEGQRLSGTSLINGEEDVGTIALLRSMWDKNLDLSASQD